MKGATSGMVCSHIDAIVSDRIAAGGCVRRCRRGYRGSSGNEISGDSIPGGCGDELGRLGRWGEGTESSLYGTPGLGKWPSLTCCKRGMVDDGNGRTRRGAVPSQAGKDIARDIRDMFLRRHVKDSGQANNLFKVYFKPIKSDAKEKAWNIPG